MLSVIIPSRVPEYLQKTVDDLLSKAEGQIEVIVVLDGYWPDPMLKDDARVKIIHQGTFHNNRGMRAAINAGVAIAKGDYIMKCDEHTMWDQGFDVKLAADCEDDWVVIPRRYRLDADNWTIIEDGRPPIDYMRIDYPYQRPYDKSCGLHGAEDKERAEKYKDLLIDDVMTMQGSAYFMSKKHWDTTIKRLEEENYGTFTQEAQEISNKTWLSGGRVIVNKKTWYAHLHKGNKGKGYGFTTEQYKRHQEGQEKGRLYSINYWLYTKDYKYDFDWLVKKFWPISGWPENWREQVEIDRLKDYSTLNYQDDFWLEGLRK
jgi:glycosyltransferase involved in cell wall biosynthesis